MIIDLVVNHTSDQHPWFQSARASVDSPYRDWYVWSTEEPSDLHQGMVFPGEQKTTWTWDDEAGAWYYHRFYDFQPDLNMANPAVRSEIEKIIGFWLQLGVSGFRMDAAPFVIELTTPNDPNPRKDFAWLTRFRERLSWRKGDAVILAEANVEADELLKYFDDGRRLPMLFNFMLNQRTFLALARQEAAPLIQGACRDPDDPRARASGLRSCATTTRSISDAWSEPSTTRCSQPSLPDPNMVLYGRGIRRRLAPMLGGDHRRIEMAYALQFTLPGVPVIRYGDEIGMGDDLSLRRPRRDPHADAVVGRRRTEGSRRPPRRTSVDHSSAAGTTASRRSTSRASSRIPNRCSDGSSVPCTPCVTVPSSASVRRSTLTLGSARCLALHRDAPAARCSPSPTWPTRQSPWISDPSPARRVRCARYSAIPRTSRRATISRASASAPTGTDGCGSARPSGADL